MWGGWPLHAGRKKCVGGHTTHLLLISKNFKSEEKINVYLCIPPYSQVVSQSSTTS